MDEKIKEISEDDMKNALKKSGYLLEARIFELLRKRGWVGKANETYPSDKTEICEIDIVATKIFEAIKGKTRYIFAIQLYCECKNNHEPIVFFTEHSKYLVPRFIVTGKKRLASKALYSREMSVVFKGYEDKTVSQYCSFKEKGSGWIAHHDESHYRSLEHLVNSFFYDVDRWFLDSNRFDIHMPVVILGGRAYYVVDNVEPVLKPITETSLRFHKVDKVSSRHIAIKVICESAFDEYLSMLEKNFKSSIEKNLGLKLEELKHKSLTPVSEPDKDK